MIGKTIRYSFNNEIVNIEGVIKDKVLVESNGISVEKYLVLNTTETLNKSKVQLVSPKQITAILE